MERIQRGEDRSHAEYGWLNSHHTSSFAQDYDSAQMCFRSLRVINDETVLRCRGFDTHSHRDLKLISYSGALKHRDSMIRIKAAQTSQALIFD